MTREERFKKSLKNRAAQLVRLIELDSPEVLLAGQVHLVRMAMIGLAPQELATIEMKWQSERVLTSAGYCPHNDCQNEIEPDDSYLSRCSSCKTEAEAGDKRLLEELALLPKEMFDGCDGSEDDGICNADDSGTDDDHCH